jgi:hypothetical protein
MRFQGILALTLPLALAGYVVPAADGSDGWIDAFKKAKGETHSFTATDLADVASFGRSDDFG